MAACLHEDNATFFWIPGLVKVPLPPLEIIKTSVGFVVDRIGRLDSPEFGIHSRVLVA